MLPNITATVTTSNTRNPMFFINILCRSSRITVNIDFKNLVIMNDFIPLEVKFNVNSDNFMYEVQSYRKPCVIKEIDIGCCTSKWNVDYLCKHSGEKITTVHVSDTPQMNFISKNYLYRKLPFSELLKRASSKVHKHYFISPHEYYYFRSLGENVRKEPSDISKQWPELMNDIKLPDFFPKEHLFSSVFRIASARMQLWTHYDVMDNLLIQVTGQKKVILFPPSDALNLYLQGDKSTVVDVENPDLVKYPNFSKTTKYLCILEPGDVLFIPALWFHNVVALEFGIAVNVFWRNLDKSFYDTKDPYGNKDLRPATRSMDIMNRALNVLDELPEEYKDFYIRKLMLKLQESIK